MAQSGKITEIVDVKAFEQIVRLQDELSKTSALMQTLSATTIQLANNTKNTTPKEAVESTKKLAQTTDLLVETQKKEVQQQNELIKSEAALNAATKQYAGSQLELKNKIALLTKEYERQSQATEEGRKKAIALKQEINKLDEAYKKNATAAQQQAKNIGNYGSAFDQVKGAIGVVSVALAGMAGVIGFVKKAMESNNFVTKEFAKVMGGLQSATEYVFRSFGNLDFGNFIGGITKAVQAGYEYVGALRLIAAETRGLSVVEAKLRGEILDQEKIWRDKTKSENERREASKKMKELTAQMSAEKVVLLNKELAAELKKASQETGMSEKNLKFYIEEERALASVMGKYYEKSQRIKHLQSIEETYFDATTERIVDNSAAYNAAQKELAKFTKEELVRAQTGERLNKLSKERKENINRLIVAIIQENNVVKERAVSMLRMDNQIEKSADKTEALAKKTERYTGEVSKIPMIQKQAGDALVDFMVKAGYTAEEIIDIQQRITKTVEDNIDKQFKKRQEYSKDFGKLLESDAQKEAEILAKQKEVYQSVYGQIQDVITGFFTASFENRQSKIDEELDQLEANKERELQLAGDNAAKKEEIERKYQSEKERIDKKAKKVEYDKAVFNRLTASANIAYSTAEAVMKAVAAFPLTGGLPWTAIIAALGSLQVASVWAAPLPKFAKGTQNAPEGFAIVGERGSEMVIDNGKAWMTPDTDTLTYLSKGAKVIPHDEVMQMAEAMGNPAIPKMTDKGLGYDITGIMTDVKHGIINAIKNKQETHINITEAGMRKITRSANGWTEYINKNIRH